jgi:hypothetical protein
MVALIFLFLNLVASPFKPKSRLEAENAALRLWGDYGYDEERDCWWATDSRGRKYRFVIEQVRPTDIAA